MPNRMELGEEEVVKGSKCQDCGNQAKRECSYSRCRTCCKNKGFECQTHIKSTWIPVDKRRQIIRDQEQQPNPHQYFLTDIPKKHNHNPYSGLEELKFPAAMNSMAIFRCVEVRSMDDTVNEIAYQTCVNIGGHVFSGILYDQGPDHHTLNIARPGGDSSTTTGLVDHQQQSLSRMNNASNLHSTRDGATMVMAPLSAHHDHHFLPPSPFPFPFAPTRPGMPYFSHPKS